MNINALANNLISFTYIFRLMSMYNMNIRKLVYFAYFHSLLTYSRIFVGSYSEKNKKFILQKSAV